MECRHLKMSLNTAFMDSIKGYSSLSHEVLNGKEPNLAIRTANSKV